MSGVGSVKLLQWAERFHVKHHNMVEAAKAQLDELALEVPDEVLSQATAHLEWVLSRNRTVNLTAITDPAEAIRLHMVDSLTALKEVEQCVPGPMCDMGSGAGFPGVPLALVSGRQTLVVDSVAKKMHALAEYLDSVGLAGQIATSSERVEVLGQSRRAEFAVVTARALAPLPSLIELAAPLLLPGGRLVAMKARLTSDELDRGDGVCELAGLRRIATSEFRLPKGHEARVLVTYERSGDSSIVLPRRIGMAQKKPLR